MALQNITGLARNDAGIAVAVDMVRQRFGDRLGSGHDIHRQHGHTLTYIANQPPDAVVSARSTEEVQDIVRICATHRVPVIPFGKGTSLEGGVNAPAGGICVDLGGMDRIIRVNAEDLDAVVEFGVTREALNIYLRDMGLFFPIDPGANASLGGMASIRASGTNAVRYGTMREHVVNVTAVMPNGSVFRSGGRAQKSSPGYDLTRLLVGSEGTLGIVTELTVHLHGIPEAIAAAIVSFPDVEAACGTTIAAMQAGLPVARIELLDAAAVSAVNPHARLGLPESPLLLLEFHGTAASVRDQSEFFGQIALETGGSGFEWVDKPGNRMRLWKACHGFYFALQAVVPGKRTVANDACFPISRLAECVIETARDIADAGLYGPILGHVGDGIFHVALLFDQADADELIRAEWVLDRLSRRAQAMDGTCTGELGVGQGKRLLLEAEFGEGLHVMQAIKQVLDPLSVMNPGKVLPRNEADMLDVGLSKEENHAML